MVYYVNISTEEMMDIILSNTARSMFFKTLISLWCTTTMTNIRHGRNQKSVSQFWSTADVLSRGEMVFKGRCKGMIVASCLHLEYILWSDPMVCIWSHHAQLSMRDAVLLKTTMAIVPLLNVVTGTTQQSWIAWSKENNLWWPTCLIWQSQRSSCRLVVSSSQKVL